MFSNPRLQISQYDAELFKHIFNHRMLRINHLELLTGRSYEALQHRLAQLARAGYLTSKKRPFQKHIYGLGRGAASNLAEQGIASREFASARIRQQELKDLFLDHLMMIVDFHVALAIAGQSANFKIATWRQGDGLRDHVTIRKRGVAETLSVWPDAFFILEDSRAPARWRPVAYMYEASRQRQSRRDRQKLLGYFHYFREGRHRKKYGVDTFRVITQTTTRTRALNLCTLAGELLPKPTRKHYLFTSLDDFSPDKPMTLLREVAITPYDSHYRRLVPSA